MANLILRDFRLARDFRSVEWGSTILYNLMRSSAAGLVLGIVIFCVSYSSGKPQWQMLAAPFIWPIGYLVMFLPFGLILSFLGSFIPFLGLVSIFFSIMAVTAGDPVICILHAVAPRFVPVARPSFLSLALIYYVLKPEETEQIAISR